MDNLFKGCSWALLLFISRFCVGAEGVEKIALRSLLLPRPGSRTEELWAAGLEHSLRVQRDGSQDQCQAAPDVPQPIRCKFSALE